MAALSAENNYTDTRFPTSGAIRAYYNGGRHRINDGHKADAPAPTADYMHTDLMAGVSAYQSVTFFRGNRTTFGLDYQHFGGGSQRLSVRHVLPGQPHNLRIRLPALRRTCMEQVRYR